MNYIWESITILFIGFCLLRIAGKKTIGELSGLEMITILAIASTTGHAISETGLIKTILALCSLVILLILIQFLTTKYKRIERLFIGKSIPVIQEGKIITNNLKKLRMTVDQWRQSYERKEFHRLQMLKMLLLRLQDIWDMS